MPNQSELLQLPFVDETTLKQFYIKKRKIESIESFLKLTKEEQQSILPSLSSDQVDLVRHVAGQYPRLEIAKAEYSVYGDPIISPSSLVTLSVKFRCLFDGKEPDPKSDNSIPDHEAEKANKKWWEKQSEDLRVSHAPYFPALKKPTFSVILANGQIGRLIGMVKVVGTGIDHVCRIQFQAPPNEGTWTFQVYIKSDTYYMTSDSQFDLKVFARYFTH